MKAIIQTGLSDPRVLEWADTPELTPEDGQVLARVKVAGVSHADLLQVAGYHPSPRGVTDTLGLEYVDVIEEVKGDSQGWKVGDGVCCLPFGDAYAEKVTVLTGWILPLLHGYSFTEAASVVEVACTVFSNVVVIASLKGGDLPLVHDSTGGIDTFAIQMVKRLGAYVTVIAGSAKKLARCKEPGTDILINYKEEDFVEIAAAEGGANVILDTMGAEYLDRDVKAPAGDGHLIIIGMQGGIKGELNIGRLLNKRGSITATGLCRRGFADKTRIVNTTEDTIWSIFADGTVTPQIHEAMGMRDAAKAHELLDGGTVSSRIVLTV